MKNRDTENLSRLSKVAELVKVLRGWLCLTWDKVKSSPSGLVMFLHVNTLDILGQLIHHCGAALGFVGSWAASLLSTH